MPRAGGVLLIAAAAACGRFDFDGLTGADASSPGLDDVPGINTVAEAYAAVVTNDTPAAYFHLDEAGGTTATSATGAITGQYQGTFAFGAPGAMPGSRAVTLDGMTSRIDVGDQFRFAGTAPYSLELWIRPTELGTTRFVIDRRTTAIPVEGYTIYMGDTYLLASRYVGGNEVSYVSIGGSPPTGRWLYVVTTWDGTVPRMYLDGALTAENLGDPSTIGAGPGTFAIGDSSLGQFYKLAGDVDEVAIYSHALSAAQVAAHFAAAH